MAAKATRCPHCQTSFRVTESQLATARGLVRCGACLEVFNAAEHWLESEVIAYENDSAKAQPSEYELDDDNILFDDDHGFPDENQNPDVHKETGVELRTETPDQNQAIASPESESESESEPIKTDADSGRYESVATNNTPDHDETNDAPESGPAPDKAPEPDDDFEQLVYQGRRRLRISRQQMAWSLLSILAALCLATQIIYANFDRIAQSAYRPELISACNVINFLGAGQRCTLPPPQNLALIRSRGLNIYSHPQHANSLLIDALIVNLAVFEQPFPLIELEFHDQNKRRIAARRFTPAEYLAGELSGLEFMPSRQTIHINIGILDPGETAVNYRMRFHPSTGAN